MEAARPFKQPPVEGERFGFQITIAGADEHAGHGGGRPDGRTAVALPEGIAAGEDLVGGTGQPWHRAFEDKLAAARGNGGVGRAGFEQQGDGG